jgi:hypothetical protein
MGMHGSDGERIGTSGGVPYLALPPPDGVERPALVGTLHMMDPPRSEAAMASALPMADVPPGGCTWDSRCSVRAHLREVRTRSCASGTRTR